MSNVSGHTNVIALETYIEEIRTSKNKELNHDFMIVPNKNTIQFQTSIGDTHLTNQLSPRITITFHNISEVINVPRKIINPNLKDKIVQKILLDNVSGQVHPGQLVALMGPSGCDKTTLLNILAGRILNGVTGNVWLNNQCYDKCMKRKFAYVLQDDIFFENLTIKQQVTYTALLRLPDHLTRETKLFQVEHILEELRLQNCANTPIRFISGGERKRVNIGTELLTNPSIILLDGKLV